MKQSTCIDSREDRPLTEMFSGDLFELHCQRNSSSVNDATNTRARAWPLVNVSEASDVSGQARIEL